MAPDIARALHDLAAVCRERGLAFTNQRRIVLEILVQRRDHPTPDQVCEAARRRNQHISRKTVYRVLDTLVDLGLARRVHHPGASTRFDAEVSRHHHLVCTRCNRIVDLHRASLDGIPLPKGKPAGFEIHDYSVQFLGLCAICRREKS